MGCLSHVYHEISRRMFFFLKQPEPIIQQEYATFFKLEFCLANCQIIYCLKGAVSARSRTPCKSTRSVVIYANSWEGTGFLIVTILKHADCFSVLIWLRNCRKEVRFLTTRSQNSFVLSILALTGSKAGGDRTATTFRIQRKVLWADTLRTQKKVPITGAARLQECKNSVCMGGEKNGVFLQVAVSRAVC